MCSWPPTRNWLPEPTASRQPVAPTARTPRSLERTRSPEQPGSEAAPGLGCRHRLTPAQRSGDRQRPAQWAGRRTAAPHRPRPDRDVQAAGTSERRHETFRLLGRLGGGAMGQLCLATSKAGRLAAVKVIRAHLAEDPGLRRRFAAEVAAARQVQGPYTPAVVDAGPQAAQPWMATAHIPGPSVREAVGRSGPLPPALVAGLAAGVAEALRAIHAAGVLHRGLEPADVLLDTDGPQVIGSGIARSLDASRLTQTGARVGTIPFHGPRAAGGRPVTAAADVFCLGSLLAYAATGITPFGDGSSGQVLYRIVPCDPGPAALAGEDNNLQDVIKACLDKEPRPPPHTRADHRRVCRPP